MSWNSRVKRMRLSSWKWNRNKWIQDIPYTPRMKSRRLTCKGSHAFMVLESTHSASHPNSDKTAGAVTPHKRDLPPTHRTPIFSDNIAHQPSTPSTPPSPSSFPQRLPNPPQISLSPSPITNTWPSALIKLVSRPDTPTRRCPKTRARIYMSLPY